MSYTIDDDSLYIFNTAESIIKDMKILTRPSMDIKYATFKDRYKKLYDMCFAEPDKKVLLKNLAAQLHVREKLKKGEESPFEANVHVSEHFSKLYLYPTHGTPTMEQKKEAIKKITKELYKKDQTDLLIKKSREETDEEKKEKEETK